MDSTINEFATILIQYLKREKNTFAILILLISVFGYLHVLMELQVISAILLNQHGTFLL